MKIVIIGGTGLIGSKVVGILRERGHDAVPASPETGVNTLTGDGLAGVLAGAAVVVDTSNSPSFDADAAMSFFETSTRNLLGAERAMAVRHHVALSIVGVERLADNGYFRAKLAQETLVRGSSIPYTIVHATQFFEFAKGIADASMMGATVHLPPVMVQPIAADDVARTVAAVAVGAPVNGVVEVAGPNLFPLDEFVRDGLRARKDPRTVVADGQARYFGSVLGERSLLPGDDARIGAVTFEAWRQQQGAPRNVTAPQVVAR